MLQGKSRRERRVFSQRHNRFKFTLFLTFICASFVLQEKTGRIRYLRVTNYADAVPKIPFVSLNIPAFLFKHVGVHLQLYDDKPPRFSYDVDGKSPLIDDKENIVVPISPKEVLHFHQCATYDNRLDKAKPKMQSLYLEDIYANKAFVGDYSNV